MKLTLIGELAKLAKAVKIAQRLNSPPQPECLFDDYTDTLLACYESRIWDIQSDMPVDNKRCVTDYICGVLGAKDEAQRDRLCRPFLQWLEDNGETL